MKKILKNYSWIWCWKIKLKKKKSPPKIPWSTQTIKSSNLIGLQKKNLQAYYTQPYSAEHWKSWSLSSISIGLLNPKP
jgi:hypothetical protein